MCVHSWLADVKHMMAMYNYCTCIHCNMYGRTTHPSVNRQTQMRRCSILLDSTVYLYKYYQYRTYWIRGGGARPAKELTSTYVWTLNWRQKYHDSPKRYRTVKDPIVLCDIGRWSRQQNLIVLSDIKDGWYDTGCGLRRPSDIYYQDGN